MGGDAEKAPGLAGVQEMQVNDALGLGKIENRMTTKHETAGM